MTPEEFITKWSEVTTLERATVQSHFNDLCVLLDEDTPHEADPTGEWYAFEKGVEKTDRLSRISTLTKGASRSGLDVAGPARVRVQRYAGQTRAGGA